MQPLRYLYCTFVLQINTSASGRVISVEAWKVNTAQQCQTIFNFRKPSYVICAGLSVLFGCEERVCRFEEGRGLGDSGNNVKENIRDEIHVKPQNDETRSRFTLQKYRWK